MSASRDVVESTGRIVLNGEPVEYRAVCRDFPVRNSDGSVAGTMFSCSYIRTDVAADANRPVLFAFNGGPGSSALWLHMGLLSPRKADFGDPEEPNQTPPFKLEDNRHCPLDVCDIVVIDPVGAGFGRLNGPVQPCSVLSIEGDAKAFADFIECWVSEENRWDSPKYLLGESYGTLRACFIANILLGGPTFAGAVSRGLTIDGIILSGASITVNPKPNLWDEYGVEAGVLDLPSIAAVNCYHSGVRGSRLEDCVREAYDFGTEYLVALYLGNRLCGERRRAVLEKLSHLTGLSENYLELCALHLDASEYASVRLSPERRSLASYDARFTLPYVKRAGTQDPVGDDASMGRLMPAFRGAFMKYASETLKLDTTREYKVIDFNINGVWDDCCTKTPFEHLQSALKRNRGMRVLFCSGMFDLVTTMGRVRYTVSQLKFEAGQVLISEYPSGHMQYIGEESAARLSSDIRDFVLGRRVGTEI